MNPINLIASRYLTSRKGVSLVSTLTIISISGITIGTALLIIVLSIFNGFFDVVKNLLDQKEIQLVLRWVESKKMLLTGGFDCVINCYKKLEFEEKGKLKNNIDMVSLKGKHTQMITDILVIEQNNVIISIN